ncbi:hypothetical protein RQP46_002457 [Phenoliferia psychrophenolica]
MATIDSLANETLIHIIEYLKSSPLPGWDDTDLEREGDRYEDLRAAALVCSRWRDPAQRALFDEPDLPDPDDPRGALFCVSSTATIPHAPFAFTRFAPSFLLLGPQLRTLVLAASFKALKGHFHVFETLRSLVCLDLDLDWESEDIIDDYEYLEAVLDALPSPPTLKHLLVKTKYPPMVIPVLKMVEHASLASIARLEFEIFDTDEGEPVQKGPSLRTAQRTLLERGATLLIPGIYGW